MGCCTGSSGSPVHPPLITSAIKIQKIISFLSQLTKKELIYSGIKEIFDFYGSLEGSSIFKESLSKLYEVKLNFQNLDLSLKLSFHCNF